MSIFLGFTDASSFIGKILMRNIGHNYYLCSGMSVYTPPLCLKNGDNKGYPLLSVDFLFMP